MSSSGPNNWNRRVYSGRQAGFCPFGDNGQVSVMRRPYNLSVAACSSELSYALVYLESFTKKIALILLAAQALLCIGAVFSQVMLHGDGSFFVYAIAAEDPWGLKWSSLLTRASTYVLTVLPTAFVSDIFRLSGAQIAAVNGLTFYGLQWLQYFILLRMAWRRFPHLLFFPIAQYGLSLGLGFGFPTEILLAPGFFWICMFSLICRPIPGTLLVAAFAGLVFSHELAIPAAILVLVFAWMQYRTLETAERLRLDILIAASGTILILWFLLLMNGGGASADGNAIYVFDPRRVLNDPTLWLIMIATLTLSASPFVKLGTSWRSLGAIGLCCAALTAMSSFVLNFAQGRYDSARTLVGVCLVGLGLIFIADQMRWGSGQERPMPRLASTMKKCAVAVLAINLTASGIFLWEWNIARRGFVSAVNGPGMDKLEIVPFNSARVPLRPDSVKYVHRMDFSWTWPFRSIVVAKDFRPRRVIVDSDTMYDLCRLGIFSKQSKVSRIPTDVTDAVKRFACVQPPPPDKRYLRHWLLDTWRSLPW